MSKTVKYILIGLVVFGALFLLGYFVFKGGTPGGLIAGLAGAWAAFKSNAFSTKKLNEEIEGVEEEHSLKRIEWERTKEEYESRFRALKARMDYLDYRSARVREKIGALDEEEQQKLKDLEKMTIDEKLRMLNNI